jgi:hypothetical protein
MDVAESAMFRQWCLTTTTLGSQQAAAIKALEDKLATQDAEYKKLLQVTAALTQLVDSVVAHVAVLTNSGPASPAHTGPRTSFHPSCHDHVLHPLPRDIGASSPGGEALAVPAAKAEPAAKEAGNPEAVPAPVPAPSVHVKAEKARAARKAAGDKQMSDQAVLLSALAKLAPGGVYGGKKEEETEFYSSMVSHTVALTIPDPALHSKPVATPRVDWERMSHPRRLPRPSPCPILGCATSVLAKNVNFSHNLGFGTLPGFETDLGIVAPPTDPVHGYTYAGGTGDLAKWVYHAQPVYAMADRSDSDSRRAIRRREARPGDPGGPWGG